MHVPLLKVVNNSYVVNLGQVSGVNTVSVLYLWVSSLYLLDRQIKGVVHQIPVLQECHVFLEDIVYIITGGCFYFNYTFG